MGNLLAVHEAGGPTREHDVRDVLAIASVQAGAISLKGYFSEREIDAMSVEASHAAKFARRISEWPKTRRATFFTEPSEVTLPIALASRIFTPSRFMPATNTLIAELSSYIRSYGRKQECPPLIDFVPNRIGVNVMQGTLTALAEIPAHVDPEAESGLVAVIELGDGKTRTEVTGNITFILGFDTCTHYGIDQYEHSVESDFRRYSISAANLLQS